MVLDRAGYALYFSRSPIPYPRQEGGAPPLKHLGIYGYQREALLRLAGLPPTPLERSESLEQLRALENGIPIRVLLVERASPGVDTQEDLERVERLLAGDLRRETMATKFIFVTGGVVSSLGKGVAAASVGAILEARGFSVTLMKFDPYINVDPGHHVPLPARRGLRHRRRRRDRPRPRPLRALHPHRRHASATTTPPARSTSR